MKYLLVVFIILCIVSVFVMVNELEASNNKEFTSAYKYWKGYRTGIYLTLFLDIVFVMLSILAIIYKDSIERFASRLVEE